MDGFSLFRASIALFILSEGPSSMMMMEGLYALAVVKNMLLSTIVRMS
jgi:hypothetical protein